MRIFPMVGKSGLNRASPEAMQVKKVPKFGKSLCLSGQNFHPPAQRLRRDRMVGGVVKGRRLGRLIRKCWRLRRDAMCKDGS